MKRTKDELMDAIKELIEEDFKDYNWGIRDAIKAIAETELVETPEPVVDLGLEEVKKKFPVGSFFKNADRGDTIFKVHDVSKGLKFQDNPNSFICLTDCSGNWHVTDLCTPFEFPVARSVWKSIWKSIDKKPTEDGPCLLRVNDDYEPCLAYYVVKQDGWLVNNLVICKGMGMQWCELPRDEVEK